MEALLKKLKKINEYTSKSPADTVSFAAGFAGQLRENDVVGLSGELGTGKTHFLKGVAKAYSIPSKDVLSPTFNIMKEYHGKTMTIYHYDFYRLESAMELEEIGFRDFASEEGAICLVEWPEKVREVYDIYDYIVRIEYQGKTDRKISVYKR
jgi:tRNA threonylcarbamoyladenosine biosynthesis protein TsaE